jgi:hypothetical protein
MIIISITVLIAVTVATIAVVIIITVIIVQHTVTPVADAVAYISVFDCLYLLTGLVTVIIPALIFFDLPYRGKINIIGSLSGFIGRGATCKTGQYNKCG